MSKSNNRYKFVSSPLFLGLYSLLFLASSLVLSGGAYSPIRESPISVLTGFLDIQSISATISVLLTLAITGVTAVIIYILNYRHFNTGKSSWTLLFLYFIFLFSSPQNIFLDGSIIAAPLYLLSLYFTIKSSKEQIDIFSAGILISAASLFDYHLLALIPFLIYYSLVKSSFSFRSLVIFISAIILPYLFVFSIRYIVFEDASLFAEIIWLNISSIRAPHLNIDSVAHVSLILFSLFIAYRAIYSTINKLTSIKIIKATALTRFTVTAILFAVIMLLYRDIQASFMTLLAIPASYLLNEYLTSKNTDKNKRGEFLVFLIILALARVAQFM